MAPSRPMGNVARIQARVNAWRDGGGRIDVRPVPRRGSGPLPRLIGCHPAWLMHLIDSGCARCDVRSGETLVGFEKIIRTRDDTILDGDRMDINCVAPISRHDAWMPVIVCDQLPEIGLWDLIGFFLQYSKPLVNEVLCESNAACHESTFGVKV